MDLKGWRVWTAVIWLRISSSDGIFWRGLWTFRSVKTKQLSDLLVSQEGLCSVEFVRSTDERQNMTTQTHLLLWKGIRFVLKLSYSLSLRMFVPNQNRQKRLSLVTCLEGTWGSAPWASTAPRLRWIWVNLNTGFLLATCPEISSKRGTWHFCSL
jgi:hypothetical protein